LETLEEFDLIEIGPSILQRAAEPFPTVLGSLDAIHLASALLVKDEFEDLPLATHDRELAIAARAVGFRVYGSPVRSASPTTAPRS
jgi:hypothetical protein